MEPLVEKANYAPEKGETGEEYMARLAAIENPQPMALQVARIIASAMTQGIYNPADSDKDMDKIQKGLKHIEIALEGFSAIKNLAGARSDLMEFALSEVQRMTGRNISQDVARELISNKSATNLEAKLARAISQAWNGIKEGAELDDPNASNKDVVKSFKDEQEGKLVDTDLSRLVEDVLQLRDKFRPSQKPGQKKK